MASDLRNALQWRAPATRAIPQRDLTRPHTSDRVLTGRRTHRLAELARSGSSTKSATEPLAQSHRANSLGEELREAGMSDENAVRGSNEFPLAALDAASHR